MSIFSGIFLAKCFLLLAEQVGINFTPFVLSLPNLKKKKSLLDGSQLKNVCLSVVCHEFVPNYLLNRSSDWAKIFITIFVQLSKKVCFYKDKFILQGVILVEF
jgi:hypothetical protein